MNLKNAIFLLNDNLRCMVGIYEADEKTAPKELFKTFDPELKVGDLVLVPSGTRHNVTVVKIVEADREIDPDTSADIKWIIGTIDLSKYEALLKQEDEAIDIIRSAEKKRRAAELRKAIFADAEDKLKGLPIASLGEPTALNAPTPEKAD